MKPSFGSPVLDATIRIITPFLLLFAIYVAIHGHTSPGGGFQAGAILSTALILIRLVRGHDTEWGLSRRAALNLACGGALVYTMIGLLSLAWGQSAFDYSALPLPAVGATRRAMASLAIELAVLVTVTGVMVLIFEALTHQAEDS